MKHFFLFACVVIVAGLLGCASNTTSYTTHELVVSPKSISFASGVSIQHLSITHTCTCPFTWNANPLDPAQVLQSASGTWDSTSATIMIDRTKLTKDTLLTSLQITTNGYGTDTIQVSIFK